MTQSAKRFGVNTTEANLEDRIRKMEVAVAQRQLANIEGSTVATLRVGVIPPQVTGLSLVQNVGKIFVKWNPVQIADLSHYEVEVSTVPSFSTITTTKFRTRFAFFDYQEGAAETTYYFRVRVLNQNGQPGPFSSELNSQTGQAVAADLEDGAGINLTDDIDDGPFSPASVSATGAGDSDTATYTLPSVTTTGGVIVPFINIIVDLDVTAVTAQVEPILTLELLRDGASIDGGNSVTFDFGGAVYSMTPRTAYTGLFEPDVLVEGTYDYSLKVTVSTEALTELIFTPVRIAAEMLDLVGLSLA